MSKLGSTLGILIKTDKYNMEKVMLKYARVLIEMSLDGPFPDTIEFINDNGVLIRQVVTYEWKPTKCNHCNMLGNEEDACKKKGVIRKVWREVPKAVVTNTPELSEVPT